MLAEFLFDYCWDEPSDDALFQRLAESIAQQLDGYAKMTNADNEYIYLNYADVSQNPLEGYGEENAFGVWPTSMIRMGYFSIRFLEDLR